MRSLLLASLLAGASLVPTGAQTTFTLNPNSDFGCCTWFDGSIRPGDRPYITTGNFQRGLAYNPATDNIILIDRAAGGGGSPNISGGIYVLTGFGGEDVRTLSTNGMGGGNFADIAVAVDDAGVIYVGNLVNDGTTSPFKLYRWLNESSGEDPVVVFSGDPGNGRPQRWGDTMDIRGSGATTQILLGTRTSGTVIGTNVAILTTADGGASFTATTLSLDVTDSSTGGGIAFGAGNTFWAKNVDVPLRQFSFDLATGQATTLRNYGTDVLPASRTLEPLAVDNVNNLLAIVDMTAGVDRVRLYDISSLATPPALLDIRDFPVDNANGTTTKGYLDFGGGRLYVHNMNNGLMGFLVESTGIAAPNIVNQPTGQRILAGRTLKLEVLAYPAVTYQWQRNGTNVPGATRATLVIPNAQTTDAGTYRVVVSNAGGSMTSSDAVVNVINPEDLFHLEPIWSAAPGSQPYINNAANSGIPNQRTIAYNALSNELYIVSRNGSASGAATIFVVNATNESTTAPAVIKRLNTNGLPATPNLNNTNLPLVGISVADDGAIYICNMAPNSQATATHPFRVFRWANSDTNTLPVQIWEGDPAGQSSPFRWGDVMDVRGGGLGTQILLDNQNASARYIAILQPTDETMNAFASTFFFQDTATPFGTTIGRSLEFGVGDTIWQKRRAAALLQSGFDLNNPQGVSPLLATHTNFPTTLCGVGLDLTRNLLAGVNIPATATPDTLDLYDVSDLQNPLLLAQYNFPQSPHNGNANFISQTIFAGDYVFSLDANNGIVAFRIASGPISPPTILRQPENLRLVSGNSGSLSVITADIATFQWQRNEANISGATNSTYPISNAQPSHEGNYRVIVSNDAGSTTSSVAVVTVLAAESFHRLSQIWSAAPGNPLYPYATFSGGSPTPNERNIAYSALSNHLYVVQRQSPSSTDYTIHVVNPEDGTPLYALNTNGLILDVPAFGGATGIALDGIDVGDDGAIYACNMTGDACGCSNLEGVFRLYRWANSAADTVPIQVFQGDPATQVSSLRWGDVMDVRGSGVGTEILLDNNQATFASILKPTSELMNEFTPSWFAHSYGAASIGRTLEFSAANTWWQKRRGSRLQLSSYDLLSQSSTVLTNYENFPSSLGVVAVDLSRNILVGIDFSSTTTAPDTLNLYDISDFNNPLLIRRHDFPENSRTNANFIGRVLFAGDRVFAINGNNGVMAFRIIAPEGPSLTIARSGANVVLSWEAPATGYVLQGTLSLSPPAWTPVSGTPDLNGNTYTLSDNASTGNKFYRLCRDCP